MLRASADRSASLYVALLKPAASAPTTLSWEWKTDALVPGADNRDKAREDAPLRVLVAFDGDRATLPEAEQQAIQARQESVGARTAVCRADVHLERPGAGGHRHPLGPHQPGEDAGRRVGASGLGSWQSVQRNLADDYRRAYGAEPGPVLGVAVMTDTDNTGTKAVGQYAGIRIGCAGG